MTTIIPFPPGGFSAGQKSQHRKPSLSDLYGMPEVVDWAEALDHDLQAFLQEEISWAEIDSGLLLYGPPGCGKTTVARAIAQHCGLSFSPTSYSEWQSDNQDVSLGHVLHRMEQSFACAAANAPSILFIDEIDAIYSRSIEGRNHDWNTYIINALLAHIDGASEERKGVIVIAATNRPQSLDPALLRAGRLGRKIEIALPDQKALQEILRFYLGNTVASEDELRTLAVCCIGKSGADIEHLVNHAKRKARQDKRPLTFDGVFDLVKPTRGNDELKRHAIHECGHAIVAMHLMDAKVAISLAKNASSLGRTIVESSSSTETRAGIIDQIAVSLGGRAAEEVVLGYTTTGCGGGDDSDLAHANRLAVKAISVGGLSQQRFPLLYLPNFEAGDSRFPELTREAYGLLEEAYERARSIIIANQPALDVLSEILVDRIALSDSDIRSILTNYPAVISQKEKPSDSISGHAKGQGARRKDPRRLQ
jgi:cell division protease FtsH